MTRFEFWSLIFLALTAVAALMGLFVLWPKRAKPKLKEAKNCSIDVFIERPHPKGLGHRHSTKKTVWFEFIADNAFGKKDCSLLSVSTELAFKNGRCIVNDEKHNFATPLPKPILAGQAEPIKIYGICEPTIEPQEKTVEGVITANFNTGHRKMITTTFIIKSFTLNGYGEFVSI